MAAIMQRVKLLQKADAQLKLVIGKIRPHPTKLECAEAFDPLLELANTLRADMQEVDIVDMMRDFLLETIAPCGDSRVLEGWTWEEIKAKDVRCIVLPRLACISPLESPCCSSNASAVSCHYDNLPVYVACPWHALSAQLTRSSFSRQRQLKTMQKTRAISTRVASVAQCSSATARKRATAKT